MATRGHLGKCYLQARLVPGASPGKERRAEGVWREGRASSICFSTRVAASPGLLYTPPVSVHSPLSSSSFFRLLAPILQLFALCSPHPLISSLPTLNPDLPCRPFQTLITSRTNRCWTPESALACPPDEESPTSCHSSHVQRADSVPGCVLLSNSQLLCEVAPSITPRSPRRKPEHREVGESTDHPAHHKKPEEALPRREETKLLPRGHPASQAPRGI